MAHGQSDANENHWPGYVDALTTMLMVLTFVMLILGVAIFAMSQNVSRVIVETIARASLIEVPDETVPVPELVDRILEKLRLHPPRPTMQSNREVPVALGQSSAQEKPAEAQPDRQETVPAGDGDQQRIVSEARAHIPPPPAPVLAKALAQTLVVDFQPRATRLDAAGSAQLAEAIRSEQIYRTARSIEIRASIDRSILSLTDARRIAYYRAVAVRAALLQNGTAAEAIRVHVDDRSSEQAGQTSDRIRVIARN